MSILDGLKRTLNIAGSTIVVSTEDQLYSQFDVIKGRVVITAPEYQQGGNSIYLELQEFWTEIRSDGKNTTTVTIHKTHETVYLKDKFDFEPRSQHEFDFEVKLPESCRVSTDSTGWCLTVSMDIPKAMDPTERMTLSVHPAEELCDLIEICEESLGFRERYKSRGWNHVTSNTYFRLLPPEVLKAEFDYLAFSIRQNENGGIAGSMIFNLQEKSLVDYFKAVIGRDKITRSFTLSRDQLYDCEGRLNNDSIAEFIRTQLKEVIEQRD